MKFLFTSVFFVLSMIAADRPNIILIMTDDMGSECIGSYGCLDYKTPHLDRLAADGLKFNQCYSQPLCTPSRVKIMTGRYSFRNYERFGLLPTSEVTFGNELQAAGYRTAIVGKWQLGGDHEQIKKFGFHEYCMLNGVATVEPFDRKTRGGGRYWGYPTVVANGALYESKKTFGPDMVSEYAVDFISKKRDNPFFLYYPMIMPHSPWVPTPDSKTGDKTGTKISEVRYFKDMIEYIDQLVGNVVTALEKSGQRENTLIMFTSDNGTGYPSKVTATNPDIRRVVSIGDKHAGLIVEAGGKIPKAKGSAKNGKKGKKGESVVIEGPVTRTTCGDVPGGKDLMNRSGTHVPLIVSWPKQQAHFEKVQHQVDDLVDFSDFYATVAELAGAKPKQAIDGISFAPRLVGNGQNAREYVFCHYWHFGRDKERYRDSIHDGKYKLYNDGRFYDLAKDLNETNPLATDQLNEVALTARGRLSNAYAKLRPASIIGK